MSTKEYLILMAMLICVIFFCFRLSGNQGKGKEVLIGILALAAIILTFGFLLRTPLNIGNVREIHPEVSYRGNLLIIKNNDPVGYYYVKLGLNDGVFKKQLDLGILANEETEVDLLSFSKPDGERFNILKYKPHDISISCQTSDNEYASFYGKFN
jgi:hypothetical protein